MEFSSYPATLLIIIITSLVSFYAFQDQQVLYRFLFDKSSVKSGQHYRVITSGFVHADLGHLIFNMITFYFFGRNLEAIFSNAAFYGFPTGNILFASLYLFAIIASSLPDLLKRSGRNYRSLGASGGVNAILFGTILFSPFSRIYLFFIPIGIPAILFGALYLAYTIYQDRQGSASGINHGAHLWGALVGIIVTIILIPDALKIFIQRISEGF